MSKQILLKTLTLTNYRNIDYAIYDFGGQNAKIIGENRIGKTNTLEAIYFLLTDKLLDGTKDIQAIKPLTDTKKTVRVEGTFIVDGTEIKLAKEYKEEWVKTRGNDELVFKGHSTTYFYNDVKQETFKKYIQMFQEDFGIEENKYVDVVRMLIDPLYLGNMGETTEWTSLRQLIISIVGDVSDDDVLVAHENLNPIQAELKNCGGRIDQLKKQLNNDKKSLNEQIIGVDGQIKLLEQTKKPTDDEVAVAKKGVEDIDNQIAILRGQNGSREIIVSIDSEINVVQAKINNIVHAQFESNQNANKEINDEKNCIQKEIVQLYEANDRLYKDRNDKLALIQKLEFENSTLIKKVEELKALRADFIEQLKSIDAQLNSTEEIICPTCHQPTPRDEIVKNLTDKRNEIIAKGKANTATMTSLNDKVAVNKGDIDKTTGELAKIDEFIKVNNERQSELQERNREIIAKLSNTNNSDELTADLRKELDQLKAKKLDAERNLYQANQEIQNKIYELTDKKEPFKKVLSDVEYYNRQMDRLVEVKDERLKLGQNLADAEQKQELVNRFIYYKLQMLDENVSKVFGDVKFQLIKENINGGFDTVCKVYIKNSDVLWKSGSKSEKIITGTYIIEKIKQALNLSSLPILFDEGGEISNNTFENQIITTSQLICVQVKDNIEIPTVIKF